MDRLTHNSITNCIKELDSLEKLTVSGEFTFEQLSDFIKEISWNLSNVFARVPYVSDEFQYRLIKLVQDNKKKARKELKDDDNDRLFEVPSDEDF